MRDAPGGIHMPTLVEELFARAKSLPPVDRARLAEELLDSLDEATESEVEAAWDQEIERRVAESTLVPPS